MTAQRNALKQDSRLGEAFEQRLLFLLAALLLMGVSAKCCQTERSRLIYEQAVVLEQGRSCYKNARKYLDVEDLGDNVAVVVESYDKNKANAWRRPATIQREAPANRPSYSGPMCVTVMRIWEYVTRVGRRARLSTEFLRSHWMCRPPMGRSGTRVETKQEKKTKNNKEQRKQARKKVALVCRQSND